MKSIITEIKNFVEALNSKFELAKGRSSKLENMFTQSVEQKVKRINRNKQSLREPWNTTEYINIGLMGIQEEDIKYKKKHLENNS